MRCVNSYFQLGITILFCTILSPSYANNLLVNLKDSQQKLLANAVVYLEPLVANTKTKPQRPLKGFIRQKNKTYNPHVSVFRKGTSVSFVNQDPHKHHVYSFSPAKKFEIKLYSGKPPKSIVFDKVGAITLGCNIHDQMLAYVYIVDTPYYALSKANGRVALNGIPAGKYRLKIWHPRQKSRKLIEQIILMPTKTKNLSFQIPLKPQWKPIIKKRSKSSEEDDDYLF